MNTMIAVAFFAFASPAPAASASHQETRALLAERRKIQLRRLRAYATRGEFPHNDSFRLERKPFFIDRAGTPCAVAHLMIESGEGELARELALANNHVRIAAITDGPVMDWILGSGLLHEEAALIQPSYEFMRGAGDREKLVERVRIQRHLRAVEKKLREINERSLDVATERLLARAARDPEFAQRSLTLPRFELPRLSRPRGR